MKFLEMSNVLYKFSKNYFEWNTGQPVLGSTSFSRFSDCSGQFHCRTLNVLWAIHIWNDLIWKGTKKLTDMMGSCQCLFHQSCVCLKNFWLTFYDHLFYFVYFVRVVCFICSRIKAKLECMYTNLLIIKQGQKAVACCGMAVRAWDVSLHS